MGLLIEFKRIEAMAGRRPGKRWGPRSLDIDIITYGTQRIKRLWLNIPHPEAAKRAFVLIPLVEIAPATRIQGILTVSRALSRLKNIPGTVKVFQ
jgi:2-amino-4-hydroxy-6-hydroxymethyldihydropteridine diphosphokinase